MSFAENFEPSLELDPDQALTDLHRVIMEQLVAAAKTADHPWHIGALSTVRGTAPESRSVVLRGVHNSPLALRCHTDLRSPKTEQIESNPNIQWLFYEGSTRMQLRVKGIASIVREGTEWQAAWDRSGLPSRRCYLAPFAPSAVTPEQTPNLPDNLRYRQPTAEESNAGQDNFGIVMSEVQSFEWLYLRHSGHVRAGFQLMANGDWTANWLAP